MAAILGDDRPRRSRRSAPRRRARPASSCPANYNTAGQIVICGEVAGVERAMALAKEAGAKRAIKLNVSGAFHSPLMEPAAAGLTRCARQRRRLRIRVSRSTPT